MKTHIVYMIQAKQLQVIKIGCSGNFQNRLADMQISSPDELTVLWRSHPMTQREAFDAESYLHKKFEHLHVRGEWHRPDAELLEFIKDQHSALEVAFLEATAKIQETAAPTVEQRQPFRRKVIRHNRTRTANEFAKLQSFRKEN